MHYIIDSLKFLYIKYSKKDISHPSLYLVDQTVHIACFALAGIWMAYEGYALSLTPLAESLLDMLNINAGVIFGWILILLFVCKPANITIKQMLSKYKNESVTTEVAATAAYGDTDYAKTDKSNNAGAFIGTLERIIIGLLLSVNQYAAIGLVLTAKSVARYDEISKDQTFAEYYLLGTLLSTLFAIAAYFIFV